MIFKYTGVDKNFKKVSATIEANSIDEAKKSLKQSGIIFNSIKMHHEHSFEFMAQLFSKELTKKELSTLSRDLSFYIKSGITISSALKLAISQYSDNKKIKNFLSEVSRYIDEGKDFATSLTIQKQIKLPQFYIQSIKASQNGGMLDTVLLELSAFISKQDKIQKKISNALAYPMFIIISAILMVSFMLSYVVPKVIGIFEQNKQDLPLITKYVLASSDFVGDYYMVILVLIITAVITTKYLNKVSKNFKYSYDGIMLKLPLFGQILLISELSRFSYMCSLLLRSGMTLVETIKLSSKLLDNVVLSKIFDDSSTFVVQGGKLSSSLLGRNIDILPKSFIQSVALGEETSMLETVLSTQAMRYDEENSDKIAFMLSLLEPIMMLVVGTIIAIIVLAMMLPIFSINIGGA
ncbi:MAG: type II secretion system F family protein [Epsilonproteobacteria bacterium]|nr:MAG: type II secretion system F family protein [Campylobacterota bacterium]